MSGKIEASVKSKGGKQTPEVKPEQLLLARLREKRKNCWIWVVFALLSLLNTC